MGFELTSKSVIRVSRGSFDPNRAAEIEEMVRNTGTYLIPKIKELQGLHSYFAGTSPSGSMVHVSLWESNAAADQMGRLKEMIVDARQAAEALGVKFIPIVNYPISWQI
jgi:hypothetical protein